MAEQPMIAKNDGFYRGARIRAGSQFMFYGKKPGKWMEPIKPAKAAKPGKGAEPEVAEEVVEQPAETDTAGLT